MTRELNRAKDLLAQEKTRMKSGAHTPEALSSIESRINFLEGQIEKLEAQIDEHIESFAKLKKQPKLLVSIPGIGESTAKALLAEIPDIHRFEGIRQLVVFAGLAPSERVRHVPGANENVESWKYADSKTPVFPGSVEQAI